MAKARKLRRQAQLVSFILGEAWQLIVVLSHQRDVVLEPNGLIPIRSRPARMQKRPTQP
jgi:hypothetical protein